MARDPASTGWRPQRNSEPATHSLDAIDQPLQGRQLRHVTARQRTPQSFHVHLKQRRQALPVPLAQGWVVQHGDERHHGHELVDPDEQRCGDVDAALQAGSHERGVRVRQVPQARLNGHLEERRVQRRDAAVIPPCRVVTPHLRARANHRHHHLVSGKQRLTRAPHRSGTPELAEGCELVTQGNDPRVVRLLEPEQRLAAIEELRLARRDAAQAAHDT